METLQEFRQWLVNKIKRLTDLSKPMLAADVPEAADLEEEDIEWEPDLDVYENAAEIVREAGENALLFGLYDLYEATRIRSTAIAYWPAPERNVCTDVAEIAAEDATESAQEAVGQTTPPPVRPDVHEATCTRTIEYALPMLSVEKAKILLGRCLAAVNELIEKGGHAASPVMPPQEAAEVAQVRERTTEEKQALAIGLLAKYPDWSLKRIADTIGVSRRTLYNWPQFKAACKMAKAKDTSTIPRGGKTSDGIVEAYSSPTKCASCGDIATQEFDGKDYCRECYLEKVQADQETEKVRREGRPSPLASRLPMRKQV